MEAALNPLLADTHEPDKLTAALNQSISYPYSWSWVGLNFMGLADYHITAADNHTAQIERKQAGELLSDLDAVEAQLGREMTRADETALAVEGIITPAPGGCWTWTQSKDGKLFVRSLAYKVSYAELQAWFWQLDKCGITVLQFPNWDSFVIGLVAIYKNLQKPEHVTLRRYIKERIQPLDPNPYVMTLMGLYKADIGPETARKLLEIYDTPFEIYTRPASQLALVPDIGPKTVKNIWKAIGRKE